MKRRRRRGLSFGSVVMIVLTVAVLAGFGTMIPRFTGSESFDQNAAQLAVALDQTIVNFSSNLGAIASQKETTPPAPLWATATPMPTATPVPTAVPKASFRLCATGMLNWSASIQKSVQTDSGYQYADVLSPLLSQLNADVTVATLRNSLIADEKISDGNADASLAAALFQSGFRALNLGHLNTLDYGLDDLWKTQSTLTDAGVLPFGAYPSAQRRSTLTLTNAGGVKLALLSYQSGVSSEGRKAVSADDRAYAVGELELSVIQEEIAAARNAGAQVVLVSLCWGKENATKPTNEQKELAQAIADAGADILLGVNPKAVQTVEILTADRGDGRYHPVLCAYSLGSLLTSERQQRTNLAGVLLHATVEYDPATDTVVFDGLTYTPTYNWRTKENGVYRYRVYPSNLVEYPADVNKDQLNIMAKCRKIIQDVMADSGFTEQ